MTKVIFVALKSIQFMFFVQNMLYKKLYILYNMYVSLVLQLLLDMLAQKIFFLKNKNFKTIETQLKGAISSLNIYVQYMFNICLMHV